MLIQCTINNLSTIGTYKVIAQEPITYNLIVEVKALPDGFTEETEIPEGFLQRCLPSSYGKELTKIQIENGRREEKIKEIKQAFEDELAKGVETTVISPLDGNPIRMNATYEDVTKLDGAFRLAQKLGATTANIGDYYDETQPDISLEDVDQISIEMGIHYSTQLAKKWNLREQAKVILIEDLETIIW